MVTIALAGIAAATYHGTAADEADDIAKAQKVLFETPYLSEVAVPNNLAYAFRRVADGATALEDEIVMQLVEDQGDGRRKVTFEFLSGRERMPFAPKEGIRGNPLVMLFLQRDVIHMARAFEGNFNYFRIRILDALRHKVTSENITRDFQGVPTEMTLLAIEPYVGDREREKFAAQELKRYEFILSPEVPGGVFQIRSLIPDGPGASTGVEETMTFAGVRS